MAPRTAHRACVQFERACGCIPTPGCTPEVRWLGPRGVTSRSIIHDFIRDVERVGGDGQASQYDQCDTESLHATTAGLRRGYAGMDMDRRPPRTMGAAVRIKPGRAVTTLSRPRSVALEIRVAEPRVVWELPGQYLHHIEQIHQVKGLGQ